MPALRQFRQARRLKLRRAPRVPSGAFRKAHAPHVLPLVARVEAQIRAEFERMAAIVLREIEPILLAKGAKRDAVSLPELWRTLHSTLRPQAILKRLFNQVNAETDRALAARLPTLPIAAVVSNGAQLEERWIRKNVDLIQVEPRVQRAVEHVLSKPLAEGVRVEDLKQQLQERLGIEARRAELIARDQTLKLAGQLQQARQTQAGIRRYVWTTSEDERVRPDHAKLDGTVQSWDSPPIVDSRTGRRAHPGGDFQCRCNSDPVLEEFSEPNINAPLPPETEPTPGFEPGAEPPPEEAAPEPPLELPEDVASAQAAFAAEQQAALEAEQARRAAAQAAEAEAERLRLEARIAEVRAAAEREAAAEAAVRAKAAAAQAQPLASQQALEAHMKTLGTDVMVDPRLHEVFVRIFGQSPTIAQIDAFVGHDALAGIQGRRLIEANAFENVVQFQTRAVGGGSAVKPDAMIQRTFKRAGRALRARHDVIRLADHLQGEGIGSKVLLQQLGAYEQLGVTHIDLDAAWIGRYYWPKIGFDLPKAELAEFAEKFRRYLVSRGVDAEDVSNLKIRSMRQIAAFKKDGQQLGKDFFLGEPLDPAKPLGDRAKGAAGGGFVEGLSIRVKPGDAVYDRMKQEVSK